MKSVKQSSFTHTSITSPAGAFYIKNDDIENFHALYKTAMRNGVELFLTEKHRDIAPVLIDLDLRFELGTGERRYTLEMLERFVGAYLLDLKRYVEVPALAEVYVMEKSAPVEVAKKGVVKDGVHIVIANVVTRPSVQMLARRNTLVVLEEILGPTGVTNGVEDVFDEQVLWKNNWQMYGSQKPNSEPYRITHHWSVATADGAIATRHPLLEDHSEYVEVVSIRNKYDETPVRPEAAAEVAAIDLSLKQSEDEKVKKANLYNKIVQSGESNFKPSCEEMNLVRKLITILNKERAESYGDWIRLGWCLRNISIELLTEWDEFSKHSKKYEAGQCDLIWYRMREGGLGIGTLHMWAKQDNPQEYRKLVSEDVSSLIRTSMSQTDYDIALVIARMFRHRYRCASHKHHTWYEYDNHRWKEIEKGYTLFYKEIPTRLFDEYQRAIERESIKSRTGDDRDKDICAKNIEILNKIATKLRSTNFVKDKMYKECLGLFYEPKFEDKLDANPRLLGFENGVYDLETDEFREGRPEDYVSLSTGINYIEYDPENPYIEDIDNFMEKVLTNKNVREYVWTLFASILDGTNRDEKFHMWTGSGCHAYDTKVMMHDGAYKPVQHVQVGDRLMGDDSTPRNVLQLFRGRDEMYKLTLKRGEESFTVNQNHVLSLKMTNTTSMCFRKDRDKWTVYWIERKTKECLVNRSKMFKTQEDAVAFRESLSENTDVINKGDIVDIKVSDYLKLKSKIGERNFYLYRPGLIEMEEKQVSLDPYMLGYWLGDGFSQGSLFITPDHEVVEYFDANLGSIDCKMTKCKTDHENADVFSISKVVNGNEKNRFTKSLEEYDLINNKHIPEAYKTNSKEKRLQLLAGILDSDGHYQYNEKTKTNQYELTLKNEQLLDDTVILARSLGYSANKHSIKKTCCNNGVVGQYYRCMIYGDHLSAIPCKVERKKAIDTVRYRDHNICGFTVEHVGEDDYYGFELDGNSRYVMEHELVTHNSNGKSKIVDLFQHTIGEYACIFNVSLLTQKRVGSSATNSELAIAKGKRFAILQEPEENERLNVGLMKELTGGDQIQCRGLFKEPIRFKPMFKMILTCNHMPSIPPDDGGTWRRIRRVEFTSKFTDAPNPENPNEFLIDRELTQKFELWKETFMVMLLRYYKVYKGQGKIKEPNEVMEYTKEYQRKNDVFADFCDSYVAPEPGSYVTVTALFEKFKEYCAMDNIKNKANKASFTEAMCTRYGRLVSYKSGKCWKGIRIKEPEQNRRGEGDDEDEEPDFGEDHEIVDDEM